MPGNDLIVVPLHDLAGNVVGYAAGPQSEVEDLAVEVWGAQDPPTRSALDYLKDAALARVQLIKSDAEADGVLIGGNVYSTDLESQIKYVGGLVFAVRDPSYIGSWKLQNGQYVTLDANGVYSVCAGIMTYIQACAIWEKDLIAQISTAQSVQAIQNIDFLRGRPTGSLGVAPVTQSSTPPPLQVFNTRMDPNVTCDTLSVALTSTLGDATARSLSGMSGALNVLGAVNMRSDADVTGSASAGSLIVRGAALMQGPTTLNNATIGGTLGVSGPVNITSNASVGSLTVSGATLLQGATTIANNVTIGGTASLQSSAGVAGDLSITGGLVAQGATLLKGTTTVNANASLSGNVVVGGTATLQSGADVTGNLYVSGGLTAQGATLLKGATTINADSTITGNAVVGGTATLQSSASVAGNASVSGALVVNSTARVTGAFTAQSTSTLVGNTMMSSNASIAGTLTTQGAASFSSSVSAGTSLMVGGTSTLTGALTAQSTSTLSGNTNVGANLDVAGTGRVTGAFTAQNTSSLLGNVSMGANASIAGTLTLQGAASFSSVSAGTSLTVWGTSTLTGALTAQSTSTLSGNTSVGANLNVAGTGRVTGAFTAQNTSSLLGNVMMGTNATVAGTLGVSGAATFQQSINVAQVATIERLYARDLLASQSMYMDRGARAWSTTPTVFGSFLWRLGDRPPTSVTAQFQCTRTDQTSGFKVVETVRNITLGYVDVPAGAANVDRFAVVPLSGTQYVTQSNDVYIIELQMVNTNARGFVSVLNYLVNRA